MKRLNMKVILGVALIAWAFATPGGQDVPAFVGGCLFINELMRP